MLNLGGVPGNHANIFHIEENFTKDDESKPGTFWRIVNNLISCSMVCMQIRQEKYT